MTDSTASPVATLPDKLSALIRVAVADMRKVQADPRYTLQPHVWLEPSHSGTGRCAVCMAGAVLAQTLGIERAVEAPDEIGLKASVSNKMYALNDVRTGGVEHALREIGVRVEPGQMAAVSQAASTIDRAYSGGFSSLESYEQAADILEKAGL